MSQHSDEFNPAPGGKLVRAITDERIPDEDSPTDIDPDTNTTEGARRIKALRALIQERPKTPPVVDNRTTEIRNPPEKSRGHNHHHDRRLVGRPTTGNHCSRELDSFSSSPSSP